MKNKRKLPTRIKPRKPKRALGGETLPSQETVEKVASILVKQAQKEERQQKYASVKTVLGLLGRGAVISAALLAPKSASVLLPLVKESSDWDAWKHFNASYLQRTLRRLEQQKDVEVAEKDGKQMVKLTRSGVRKVLKYSIDALAVDKPKRWDGKWRLVIYDVPVRSKTLGDLIRQTLKTFGFYAVQDSVYLFPYPCFDQIEFLREYYGLGDRIQYMLVDQVERDAAFKTYFNLS